MFEKSNNIRPFLKSLNYWQTINLYITLRQAESDISFEDARAEALLNFDTDKLKFMLEEAINSPKPKHHSPIEKSLF